MQLSNELLLAVGIAAVAISPVLDHVAVALASAFRRLDAARRRSLVARARAAAPVASLRGQDGGARCGCG